VKEHHAEEKYRGDTDLGPASVINKQPLEGAAVEGHYVSVSQEGKKDEKTKRRRRTRTQNQKALSPVKLINPPKL